MLMERFREVIGPHHGASVATACICAVFSLHLSLSGTAQAAPIVFSASGGTTAAIQTQVDAFRAQLGTLNANVAGTFGAGRREINWDGVPDALAGPTNLAANFFNLNSPRGVVFSTPGTGFQVSANAASATAVEFGNINASYPALFATFSAQRLFTAIGSNTTDVDFFVPGTTTDAATRGFGAVFTDVDIAGSTSLTFFDNNNIVLGAFTVPASGGNGGLSFLGVFFNDPLPLVDRVRITSGNSALGPNDQGQGFDLVVMDDFIYGEPIARAAVATPAPASLTLLASALVLLGARRRRALADIATQSGD